MSLYRTLRAWIAIVVLSLGTVRAFLAPPGCQTVAPPQNTLTDVHTAQVSVPGNPFGLIYALQKKIPLPTAYVKGEGALGLALTHNGRHVLVSAGPGIIIVDAARAVHGRSDAVVGALNGTTGTQMPGTAAIEVTVSLNDRYAFVSQEYGSIVGATSGNIDVFKLKRPASNGSISGTAIGFLNLGAAVVGTALSPDGRTLYAVSELVSFNSTQGSLSVVDVKTLETDPSEALLANVTSGCGPVRTLVSSDGKTVWVTARESNRLLAFDAARLLSNPREALLASVQVGTSPVGLTFARNESRILTADSNRFNYTNTTTGLSVVDVDAALAGNEAVLGRVPTGLFPREFAVSSDGSVILVADFDSRQIQAVDASSLP